MVSFWVSRSDARATLFPLTSLMNVLRQPLTIRGADPSQNRFARSTAFTNSHKCFNELDTDMHVKKDKTLHFTRVYKEMNLVYHNLVTCS